VIAQVAKPRCRVELRPLQVSVTLWSNEQAQDWLRFMQVLSVEGRLISYIGRTMSHSWYPRELAVRYLAPYLVPTADGSAPNARYTNQD
jgi:hypothetical protein